MNRLLAGLAIAATAALVAAMPLFVYGTTLAAFGLAHVLSELRYVDGRFGPRLGLRLRWWLGAWLLAIVSTRVGRLAGWLEGDWVTAMELCFVLALGVGALPRLRGALARGLAALALGGLAAGLWLGPFATILTLAVLHNWTPVGFIAEATRGQARRAAMGWSILVFGLVPGLLASGLPTDALQTLGWHFPDLTLLHTGPLAKHLGVYVPKAWLDSGFAVPMFQAVVFAQCMHYAAVLHVLPNLEGQARSGPLSGLGETTFLGGVLVLGALLLFGFTQDFSLARSVYGVAAAVHAWVEVPLLLLALTPVERS